MTDLPYLALLAKMAAMFVVMGAGWWMRRSGWLGAGMTPPLSRLIIQVAFPCLTLDQMLRTLDRSALQQSVPLLVMGLLVMLLSALVGWGLFRGGSLTPARRRTGAFLVTVPNWIFLPLPLAQSLAGDVGTRTILLLNVPAQLILWTVALALLRGSWRGAHGLRSLAVNPGLLATLAGIALAILFPSSGQWHASVSPLGIALQGIAMVGSLTVPLSLLVTGVQLAETQLAETRLVQTAPAALGRVLVGRLLVAPVLCVMLIEWGGRLMGLDEPTRLVTCIVAAMPIAVTCGLFVERYGGDLDLASQGILLSTVASLLSVPAVVALVGWMR